MDKFKKLLQEGEHLRENEGDMEGALEKFNEALKLAETNSEISNAKAQIGLTQWHMRDYEASLGTFLELLTFGEQSGYDTAMALAYRNLSRPELTSESTLQVSYAAKAYAAAERGGHSDLVWYAHGVVGASSRNGLDEDVKEWLVIEKEQLDKVLSGEVEVDNSNGGHQIWHTGYLMDKATFEGDPTILDEALQVIDSAPVPLPLRVKQIEQLRSALVATKEAEDQE